MKWTAKQLKQLKQHDACGFEVRHQGPHVGVWCKHHDIRIRWIPKEHEQNVRDFVQQHK